MTILRRTNLLNKKGQAMVEMAFVIGLLVVLIFGMTEFGRAMYTKNTLNNAARAGARVAVVTSGITNGGPVPMSTSCTYDCSKAPNDCIYQAVCNSIVAAIDKNTVKITVALSDKDGKPKSPPAITGDQISVTVVAGFNPVLALMRRMISNTLTGQATMRFE